MRRPDDMPTIHAGEIIIEPYKLDSIKELVIEHEINEHATLKLKGILKSDQKDQPIYDTTEKKCTIVVKTTNPKVGILFIGIVEIAKVLAMRSVYQIEIEAKSFTVEMDRKYISRSFQDVQMKYVDIIKNVMKDYQHSDVIDNVTQGKKTEQFVLQYEETDWQFIKRLASHHRTCLVPEIRSDGVKFTIGLPNGDKRKLDESNGYTVLKDVADYLKFKANEDPNCMDLDKLCYEVLTDLAIFRVGDHVTLKGKPFVIIGVSNQLSESQLLSHLKLTSKKGYAQPKLYNEKIIGLSIQGTVIEVKKDEVKLHLCIDKGQSPKHAFPLKYATVYSASGQSGWYFMPELKDTVLAYFPTRDEKDVFASHSLRTKPTESDKISNPDIKYLRTKYGKELKFAPDEIVITCIDEEMYIKMNEKTGIEIFSTKPIQFHSQKDVSIKSDKKINIAAKEELNLSCKSSLIKMDGEVLIQGKEVKHN